jgi:hypothetical protein
VPGQNAIVRARIFRYIGPDVYEFEQELDVVDADEAWRQLQALGETCLPEDLGLSVRVVEALGEHTASTVRQNFWRTNILDSVRSSWR